MGRSRGILVLAPALLALLVTACVVPGQRPAQPAGVPGAGARGAAGPDDVFDETRRMIEEARSTPLPPGNHRVDVERLWLSEGDLWAIGALFRYADENVKVAVGSPAADPGFRIGVAGGDFSGVLSATASRTSRSERSQLFLVTVAGSPASLLVGEQRMLAPRRILVPWWPGGVLVLPADRFVGASLDVTVEPAGPGVVSVSLTPSFSGAGDGGSVVRLVEATTTVLAPLGRPVLIASHGSTRDDVASAILSRRTERGEDQGVLVLTVTGG